MDITIIMQTIDGINLRRDYKTIKGARTFLGRYLGTQYDIAGTTAVSGDGVAVFHIGGSTFEEVLGLKEKEPTVHIPWCDPSCPLDQCEECAEHARGQERAKAATNNRQAATPTTEYPCPF